MFDTTCAAAGKWRARKAEKCPELSPLLDGNRAVGAITWEEHCVECGQPECFKSCKMYERSFDGKCRRFEGGIVPLKSGGRCLHGCTFRKWAKLEGVFSGRLRTVVDAARLAAIDRVFAKFAQLINRAMSFVPGRIGAITVYRRLKLWVSRMTGCGSAATVGGLVMRCRASRPVKLHFSIIVGERSAYDEVFDLSGEWQDVASAFKPVGKGARFLLFAIEEDPFDLIFETLELIEQPMTVTVSPMAAKGTPATSAKFVKCVAWDLDNTLWRGILVEDGADKLVVNEAAVKLIKTLDARGIVNTILSKNDYEPAWKALERFGLAEYFVFPAINWMPKSSNLAATAKAINIGVDTFAFIDDSAFERGEVGERLPSVRVFKETQIGDLADRPEFNPPVSKESANRRLSYQKEMQRVAAANAFQGDYDEFLRSCKIELEMFDLRTAGNDEYQRCYELIQRTNQLTLAGRRYTEEEFRGLVARNGMNAYGIRCSDRFGDYGIVGAVLYSVSGSSARVEEFVMSCRVAKKKCEERTLRWVAQTVKASGVHELEAVVIETGRNTALVCAFSEIPGMTCERNDVGLTFRLCVD